MIVTSIAVVPTKRSKRLDDFMVKAHDMTDMSVDMTVECRHHRHVYGAGMLINDLGT